MAKDPAFLFYPGDWQGGTITMSRFLKGCYIDLLIAQFNSGPLSLEEVKTVLGADFGQSWPILQKKFKTTESGLFFNERLEVEKSKRVAYSESRKNNRKKHMITHMKNICETHVEHMENENRNRNKDFKGGAGGKQEPGYFFKIKDKVHRVKVSEYFKENFELFLQQWQMKNKSPSVDQIFNKMDVDYSAYSFTNENHVQNAFKSVSDRILKDSKKSAGESKYSVQNPKNYE